MLFQTTIYIIKRVHEHRCIRCNMQGAPYTIAVGVKRRKVEAIRYIRYKAGVEKGRNVGTKCRSEMSRMSNCHLADHDRIAHMFSSLLFLSFVFIYVSLSIWFCLVQSDFSKLIKMWLYVIEKNFDKLLIIPKKITKFFLSYRVLFYLTYRDLTYISLIMT